MTTTSSLTYPARRFVRRTLLSFLLAVPLAGPLPAHADEEHIFCVVYNGALSAGADTAYYSAIFLADYSRSHSIEFAFYEYLKKEGYDPDVSRKYCFFGNTNNLAQLEYKSHVRKTQSNYDIVNTNWAPDNFSSQPLRDFNIEISSRDREVRVCVRDHECEDGDKVRVSVNGSRVYSGEIDNDWDCKDVRVSEGRNSVELFAVNGTGRKGNCSYADVNTGEIRVEGRNTETQSWRHRGGAGSRANIIVEVK